MYERNRTSELSAYFLVLSVNGLPQRVISLSGVSAIMAEICSFSDAATESAKEEELLVDSDFFSGGSLGVSSQWPKTRSTIFVLEGPHLSVGSLLSAS